MNADPLLRHPAMDLLKKALSKECRLQLLASFLLLLGSMALLIFTFEKSIILPIIGLISLVVSIHLIYRTARMLDIQEHRLMRMLHHHPNDIVWVYSVKTERLPFGVQLSSSVTLYFKLNDGDELSVSLPQNDLKLISKWLNRLLPHATFGYSSDKAQWYHISPDMLRRSDKK